MGRTVAHHVLHARVLRDAVSDVWYARHAQRPNQQAVVRMIAADSAAPAALEACLAEARAASDVLHHNLARVLAVGDASNPFVLSRFARITPLSAEVSRPWALADAIALLGPVGDALDAAADAGIPHGAVHLRSIWIEDRRSVGGSRRGALSGFGLHHLLAAVAARDSQRAPPDDYLYVAPELLRGASPTNRSDQYALAAAIHHAVSGRPPFQRPTLAALFGAHMFAQPPGVGGDHVDAADELDAILGRALAKDPDDRFERCRDLVAALEPWCETASDQPRSADPKRPAEPTSLPVAVSRPPSRRARLRLVTAAALVAGVVAVGLTAVVRNRDPAPAADTALTATSIERSPAPAPAPDPARVTPADPAVRWRGQLDRRPTAVHVAPAGLVVEAGGRTTVVDPATGEVLGDLPGAGDGVVAAGGQFVTDVDGRLQSVDVSDGSVTWDAPVDPASTPTVFAGTVYGISDDDVPQLIATDAGSGERLWAFPTDEPAFPAEAAVAAQEDFVYLADDRTVYGILPTGAVAGTDTPLIGAAEPAAEPLCLWRREVDEQLWAGSLAAVDACAATPTACRAGASPSTACAAPSRRSTPPVTVWSS